MTDTFSGGAVFGLPVLPFARVESSDRDPRFELASVARWLGTDEAAVLQTLPKPRDAGAPLTLQELYRVLLLIFAAPAVEWRELFFHEGRDFMMSAAGLAGAAASVGHFVETEAAK